MANALYGLGKQTMLTPTGTLGTAVGTNINLTTDNIYAALVTASYTPNYSTDQYYSTVSANVVGSPVQLTSPTVSVSSGNAVFNAANVTFTSVSGSQVTQVVIYKNTGTTTTSPLIANINVATGLPVTPNGGNITISWDTGANKIFAF